MRKNLAFKRLSKMTECRTCLEVTYVQMHLISDTRYLEIYEKLSGSMLSMENGRPDKICTRCNLKLDNFCIFFEKSQESERVLNKRISDAMENSHVTKDRVTSMNVSRTDDDDVPEVIVTVKEEPLEYNEYEELKEEYLDSPSEDIHTDPATTEDENIPKLPPLEPMSNTTSKYPPLSIEYPVHVKTENLEITDNITEKILHNLGIALDISLKNSPELKYSTNKNCSKYICDKCNYKSQTARGLKLHSKVHDQTLGYACQFCSYRFVNEKKLIKHSNYCTVCGICGKRFSSVHCLRIHVRLHTGIQLFNCDICGRGFNQKTNLQTHMRVHKRDLQYPCTYCDKIFPFQSYLNRHIVLHTKPIDINNFKQIINCHKRYTRKNNKKCICSVCGRILNKNGMNMHMRLHTGEKSLNCERCGRVFIQKCNLLTHIERLHNSDELFLCALCHRIFPLNQEMKMHFLTHFGNISVRDFEIFQQKYIYKVHSKLCNGHLTPYPCDMCNHIDVK